MLLDSRWEKPEAQSSEYIYNEYLKCISTNISMHFQFVNTIYVICTVCLHIVVCIWILLSDTRKGHKSNSLAHHSLLHHHHHRLSLVKALLLYYQTEKLLRQRILLCWTLPKRSWTQVVDCNQLSVSYMNHYLDWILAAFWKYKHVISSGHTALDKRCYTICSFTSQKVTFSKKIGSDQWKKSTP